MLEYAKVAMHTHTPWTEWQEDRQDGMGWRRCSTTPAWEPEHEYRHKWETCDGAEQHADNMMEDLPPPMQIATARVICTELWRAGYRKITTEN